MAYQRWKDREGIAHEIAPTIQFIIFTAQTFPPTFTEP
jgi:hypothetical protein